MGCVKSKRGQEPKGDVVQFFDADGVTWIYKLEGKQLMLDKDGTRTAGVTDADIDWSCVPKESVENLKALVAKAAKQAEKTPLKAAKVAEPPPPPKRKALPEFKVLGKVTAIVEVIDGGLQITNSEEDLPIKERLATFEQIALVIDPRKCAQLCFALTGEVLLALKGKTTVFTLLPSTTSSPQSMLCAEVALQCLAYCFRVNDVKVDAIDNEDVIKICKNCIIRMDDYYKTESRELLSKMMEGSHQIYPEESRRAMVGFLDPRFQNQIYRYRAFCAHPVGYGLEEGEIGGSIDIFKAILKFGSGLPDLKRSDGDFCGAVQFIEARPTYYVFDDKCAELYPSATRWKLTRESPNEEYEPISSPIFLLGNDAITWKDGEYQSECMYAMEKFREVHPDHTFTVVLLNEKFESFGANKWYILSMNVLIECVDICIFATYDELDQVTSFFSKSKHPTHGVARSLQMSQIAFPRLHFFTMSTAMGQELEDNEVLFGALTVGTMCDLPGSKYYNKAEFTPFILTGEDNTPMYQRTIPAEDDKSRSVIMPGKLLQKMMSSITAIEGDATIAGIFGEGKGGGMEDGEIGDALANINDLLAEIDQYSSLDPGPVEEE